MSPGEKGERVTSSGEKGEGSRTIRRVEKGEGNLTVRRENGERCGGQEREKGESRIGCSS
jgi:hypothetical protein